MLSVRRLCGLPRLFRRTGRTEVRRAACQPGLRRARRRRGGVLDPGLVRRSGAQYLPRLRRRGSGRPHLPRTRAPGGLRQGRQRVQRVVCDRGRSRRSAPVAAVPGPERGSGCLRAGAGTATRPEPVSAGGANGAGGDLPERGERRLEAGAQGGSLPIAASPLPARARSCMAGCRERRRRRRVGPGRVAVAAQQRGPRLDCHLQRPGSGVSGAARGVRAELPALLRRGRAAGGAGAAGAAAAVGYGPGR